MSCTRALILFLAQKRMKRIFANLFLSKHITACMFVRQFISMFSKGGLEVKVCVGVGWVGWGGKK